MYVRKPSQTGERTTQKGLEGTVIRACTGQGIVTHPNSQSGKTSQFIKH